MPSNTASAPSGRATARAQTKAARRSAVSPKARCTRSIATAKSRPGPAQRADRMPVRRPARAPPGRNRPPAPAGPAASAAARASAARCRRSCPPSRPARAGGARRRKAPSRRPAPAIRRSPRTLPALWLAITISPAIGKGEGGVTAAVTPAAIRRRRAAGRTTRSRLHRQRQQLGEPGLAERLVLRRRLHLDQAAVAGTTRNWRRPGRRCPRHSRGPAQSRPPRGRTTPRRLGRSAGCCRSRPARSGH